MPYTNKELIAKLNSIGKLPTSEICDQTDFPLGEFDDLLAEFTVPVDLDTAVSLVNLSPPVNESCHGVEWSIIHLVETAADQEFQSILDKAEDGEVKRLLRMRFENYNGSDL